MSGFRSFAPAIVLTAVAAAVMFGGPRLVRQMAYAQHDARITKTRQGLDNSPLITLNQAFRDVAQAVEPSVVHLSIGRTVTSSASAEGMLRRFFRRNDPGPDNGDDDGEDNAEDNDRDNEDDPDPESDQRAQRDDAYDRFNVPQEAANGSGWVYQHRDGRFFIITNNHVVAEADRITAKFHDKTERLATVVGTDPLTDIAVLHVDGDMLHPAPLAPEPVEKGDIVFAFGSPFQFEFSVSQGIVSGKGRQIGILNEAGGYEEFIQTDALINQGNSGGPLTNIRGQVVGMNAAISIDRTNPLMQSVGFAIPAPMIRQIVGRIVESESGTVSRGFLGISLNNDLDAPLARSFGFDGQGALVADVTPGFPAAEAGIQPGDIITAIGGRPVTSMQRLRSVVAAVLPGRPVDVELWRWNDRQDSGRSLTLSVTLAEKPQDLPERMLPLNRDFGRDARPLTSAERETLRRIGIEQTHTVTPDLDSPLAQRLRQMVARFDAELPPGVLIEDVRLGSAAATVGLFGSVVLDVAGAPVTSVDQMLDELAGHDLVRGVRLRVQRGIQRQYIVLRLPGG